MHLVRPVTRYNIDRTSRCTAVFRREAVIDHLKLLHNLRRELSAACARIPVVVIQAVDGDVVAARPQTAKAESARLEWRASSCCHGARGTDAGGQQDKVQGVAG